MSYQEETIQQIVNELQQLPESYLGNVYEIVRTLRAQIPPSADHQPDQSEPPPFVDEIDRVQEQSQSIPGRRNDQYFS